ncbi:MAG: hypothetical protein LJE96_06055 [Deltaproteobacteria bacterium]|nr:hypothetical protein [Deltaproteobacteria bacterium]
MESAPLPPVNLGIQSGRHQYAPEGLFGSGYDDPLERDVERVEEDVREGYVSLEAAEKDYGVIIDSATGLADQEATLKMRETLRG